MGGSAVADMCNATVRKPRALLWDGEAVATVAARRTKVDDGANARADPKQQQDNMVTNDARRTEDRDGCFEKAD